MVIRRWYQVWKLYTLDEYYKMGAPCLRCACGNEDITCGLLMMKALVQIGEIIPDDDGEMLPEYDFSKALPNKWAWRHQ